MNMEIKITDQIRMEGDLPFFKVEEFGFEWKPNKHAFLTLTGYLNGNAENYLEKAYDSKIRLWFEESGITLFYGYLVNVKVNNVGNVKQVILKASSGSFMVDRKLKSESFQNLDETYAEIAHKTAEHDGARVICMAGKDMPIRRPIIRYQETAWQFSMRLASYLGISIVPDIMTGEQNFWFGMRNGERSVNTVYEVESSFSERGAYVPVSVEAGRKYK